MAIKYVKAAQTAYPTGNPDFSVKQCFPSVIPESEADPFLMCDEFGPVVSSGAYGNDTDEGFDVPWHPHHGMDILSYIVEGVGRHADSLGNRETYAGPGFQWMSVGSGVEHAEGGGTPRGEKTHGFQIWLKMPRSKMEDDPRYGTVGEADIPTVGLDAAGSLARVISGGLGEKTGPAQFGVTAQILDVDLKPGATFDYDRPPNLDTVMFYAFKGAATLNAGKTLNAQEVALFDAESGDRASVVAGDKGFRMMVFAGKRTNEDVTWHGPFVCADRRQLMDVFKAQQSGRFPPVRVPYDYKDASKTPACGA